MKIDLKKAKLDDFQLIKASRRETDGKTVFQFRTPAEGGMEL